MKKQIMEIAANEERKAKREKQVTNQEITLLYAVERIANLAEDSELCDEFMADVSEEVAYIAQKMQINERQAVLLAVLANFFNEWSSISDIATYLGVRRLQALHYIKDLIVLRKRRFINIRIKGDREVYRITTKTLEGIRDNHPPVRQHTKGLSLEEFFNRINELVNQRKKEEINLEEYIEDIKELIQENTSLPFVASLKGHNLDDSDLALFIWGCDMLISDNDGILTPIDLEKLYEGKHYELRNQINAIRRKHSRLMDKNLIRPLNNDGVSNPDVVELTPYVRNEMLQGLGVELKAESENLILHTSITPKQLFYNPREERSLSQLRSLLKPDKFDDVCSRLEERGMRRGFACLFYGGPGTGKTETVLQLARQTGRNLMQVNISEIKSMWVGESEKNIKALFDRYRKLVSESEHAPILFFNEADAVIGKRMENAERAVDKMENSMQNIILQEIENMEGILIATTNLMKNLDSAFERRFLYKVEFAKPSEEAKRAIWQSMLPSLSESDVAMLATKYDFSGGQIENISRKQTVEEILTGLPTDIKRIIEFCNEEHLDNNSTRPRIGF